MSVQIFNRSMLSGERLGFTIDVSARAIPVWEANAYIPANAVFQPTSANETGFLYQNGSTAGQTGPLEPNWTLAAGQQVPDGSLLWTTIQPPASGEDAIQSVVWTQLSPPDGALILNGQTNSILTASGYMGGGTSGNVYTVNVQITMVSGAVYVARIVLMVG